jgi:hypothetical protein
VNQNQTNRSGQGLADLRPSSPGQLALIGLGLWIAGLIIPMLGILTFLGIAALVVAGLSLLIRPRTQEKYWRGRRIDMDGESGWGERLYRTIYRR